MARAIIFRPAAEADLIELFDYVAGASSPHRAGQYIDRIEAACLALAEFPERGSLRNDLYPNIRIIGFERRASIAFIIDDHTVRIVRVFYGGRQFPENWDDVNDGE